MRLLAHKSPIAHVALNEIEKLASLAHSVPIEGRLVDVLYVGNLLSIANDGKWAIEVDYSAVLADVQRFGHGHSLQTVYL